MKSILTDSGLTVIDNNGKRHMIKPDHLRFQAICVAVSNHNQEEFEELLAVTNIVKNDPVDLAGFTHPRFQWQDGDLYFDGIWKADEPILKKLESMLRYEMSLDPFIKFLDKLYNNVSSHVVAQLIRFLNYRELPITEDGNIIGYKKIGSDKYSLKGNTETKLLKGVANERGQILNEVGHVIEVRRNQVDENMEKDCSYGLHIGSYNYAKNNYGTAAGNILATVEFSPEDVVAVPRDYNGQKLRCCKYTVVSHEIQTEIVTPVSDGIYGQTPAPEVRVEVEDAVEDFLTEEDWGVYSFQFVAERIGASILEVKQVLIKWDGKTLGDAYISTREEYVEISEAREEGEESEQEKLLRENEAWLFCQMHPDSNFAKQKQEEGNGGFSRESL